MPFDNEGFIKAIHEVVAEFGTDYVYEPPGTYCVYFDGEGNGSCLIGRTLEKMGYNRNTSAIVEGQDAESVLAELGASSDIAIAAYHVQLVQDGSDTWGLALFEFDKRCQGTVDVEGANV